MVTIVLAGPIISAIESSRSDIDLRVGNWVWRTAAAQIMEWQVQGMSTAVHVNISARHFLHPTFLIELQKVCALSPQMGSSLSIEITETAMLEDLERAKRIMIKC